jgi:AraC-like DNA-binding protein
MATATGEAGRPSAGTTVSEAAWARPGPGVAPWVEGYLGYRMAGFAPGLHTGMPSHRLTFEISLDDPVDVRRMPGDQPPGRFQALVSGLHAGPVEIAHDGNQHGISVELTPLGARALFGLPAGELASQVVDLADVLDLAAVGPVGSLVERLREAPTWLARFALLDTALATAVAARADCAGMPSPEVAEAFRLLVASGGCVDIGHVAREVGWSRRHLGERFHREFGLAPKPTARLVRFDRAKSLLKRRAGAGTVADVAAATGYADQAHFTREFRALAGSTPTRWLAEELPSVQDAEDLGPAR